MSTESKFEKLTKGAVNKVLFDLESSEDDPTGHSLYSIAKSVADSLDIDFKNNKKELQKEVRIFLHKGMVVGAVEFGKNKNRYKTQPAKTNNVDKKPTTKVAALSIDFGNDSDNESDNESADNMAVDKDPDYVTEAESSDSTDYDAIAVDKKAKQTKTKTIPKTETVTPPKKYPTKAAKPKKKPSPQPSGPSISPRLPRKPLKYCDTVAVIALIRRDIIQNLNEPPHKALNKKIRYQLYCNAAGYFTDFGYPQYYHREALPAPVVFAIRTAFP